jgi:hypothetical protein
MNIVGIDPSLISTAIVINGKIINYCRKSKVYGKSGMSKWFKLAQEHVVYKFIEYRDFEDYSEGELTKLKDYDKITDDIVKEILNNIDKTKPTKIAIEGYNFGAQVGDLIDLVTFSTLLRKKLYDQVSKDILVLSPSTLKLEACKLTYQPIIKEIGGKKPRKVFIYKNKIGISGGKFKKPDMYLSIIENEELNDDWKKHCLSVKGDLMSISNIPKPYEDCNDAYLLYQIVKKKQTQS